VPQSAPGELVLAADTVVVLDGAVLGKPADPDEARAMLMSLRDRSHRVLTGLAMVRVGEIAWSSVVETTVWMRAYGDTELDDYVRSGSPLDKAGAYGIQDASFRPVNRIVGCYTNVVGLPLCEVRRALSAIDPAWVWDDAQRRLDQCER
jgi:MAF protein